MVGMGEKGIVMAYIYVSEAECKRYRNDCVRILKEVCTTLKREGISAQFSLIGSGSRNMVTRNGDGPYDLDYNLEIIKAPEEYWHDLWRLKEKVRRALNDAEGAEYFDDAHDSTSCLNAILYFEDSSNIEFSFDVAIITKNENGDYMRLIHNKGLILLNGHEQFTWNEVRKSSRVKEKTDALKHEHLWQKVRDRYLELKNMYLRRNDNNHPSFIVYVEAVNEIYNKYFD